MRHFVLAMAVLVLAACTHSQTDSDTRQVSGATADSPAYAEGYDYHVLEQQIIDAPDVIEIFFYGCEACYRLAPEVFSWSTEKAIDVVMVPAHNQQQLVSAARLFHTLDSMGLSNLQLEAFALYHEESEQDGEERINAMLQASDVEPEQFWSVWGSDIVNQRLSGSYALNAMLGVNVTPTFIVKGKYSVEIDEIGDSTGLFALLEHLVTLEE